MRFFQGLTIERRRTYNDILEIKYNGSSYIISTRLIEELLVSGERPVDVWLQGKGIVGSATCISHKQNVLFDTNVSKFSVTARSLYDAINSSDTGESRSNSGNNGTSINQHIKHRVEEAPPKRLSAPESVLINPDPEGTVGEIPFFCLGTYCPQHHREHNDPLSKDILRLKDQYNSTSDKQEVIKKYTNVMRNLLHTDNTFVICVMPNSCRGFNSSGLRDIARNLSLPPIIDGTGVLERIQELPAKHLGGLRDYQKEIESLRVNAPNIIRNRIVLLLDDVTTTGTSLRAGRDTLLKADAADVVCFALGKTYRDN